jgi:hypothetical protein
MKLLIMQFSPTSCLFIPLGPNILLNTLFSNTTNNKNEKYYIFDSIRTNNTLKEEVEPAAETLRTIQILQARDTSNKLITFH